MVARHILITEKSLRDVASRLADLRPDLETRFVPFEELRLADLAWSNTWIGFRPPVSAAESNIRWFHSASAGLDNLTGLTSSVDEYGAIVTNTVGKMPERIAEYVVATYLSHIRLLPEYRENQRSQRWLRTKGDTALAKKVTVVGTGHIGQEIARKLRPFVAQVRGLSLSGAPKEPFDAVATLFSRQFLDDADLVVAIVPNTGQTRGIFADDFFGALRGAVLVNVGRGVTVDAQALRHALDAGSVLHAILDVVEEEPLPATDWRWVDPRVTLTPHISGITETDDVVEDFLANLDALVAGRSLPNAVDVRRGY